MINWFRKLLPRVRVPWQLGSRGFWCVVPLTLEQAATSMEETFALESLRYEREDGDEWYEAECSEFVSLRVWRPYHRGEPEFAAPLCLVFGHLPDDISELGQRLASTLRAPISFGTVPINEDFATLAAHARFEPVV